VEDEPSVQRLAEYVLKSLGFQVMLAKDGQEGLDTYKEHTEGIDLIFTDVLMPHLHGPAMADRIREISPEIPVLYASGFTGNSLENAFDGYPEERVQPLLPKPYIARQLAAEVSKVLYGEGLES